MVRRFSLTGLFNKGTQQRRASVSRRRSSTRKRLEHQDSLELLRQQRAEKRRHSLPAVSKAPTAAERKRAELNRRRSTSDLPGPPTRNNAAQAAHTAVSNPKVAPDEEGEEKKEEVELAGNGLLPPPTGAGAGATAHGALAADVAMADTLGMSPHSGVRGVDAPAPPAVSEPEEANESQPGGNEALVASTAPAVDGENSLAADEEEEFTQFPEDQELPRPSEAFSMILCVHNLRAVGRQVDATTVEPFLDACREISKIFALLGRGLGFACSTINEYIEIVDIRMANLQNRHSVAGQDDTLQQLVLTEIDNNAAETGGGKNSSGARTILRLMWFFDFVQALAYNIVTHRDMALNDCGSDAYRRTLMNHHPWLVRKTVGAAMRVLPDREDFLLRLAVTDSRTGTHSVEAAIEGLDIMQQELQPISTAYWAFYREHNIDQLT